jgi:hypothetical protein
MMDLYCRTCTEPWDNDSLHDEARARKEAGLSGATYREVATDFAKRGCHALETEFGRQTCEPADAAATKMLGAIYELMGDDMDGAAAVIDDARFCRDLRI